MSKRTKAARRSAAEWASLIEACEASGLSREAFAEREGIHLRTFTWWACRLGARAKRAMGRREAAKATSSDAGKFVAVRVRAAASASTRVADRVAHTPRLHERGLEDVEIVLANGRRVRCELGQANDPRLAMLLKVAEGAGAC